MSIQIGENLPNIQLMTMSEKGPQPIQTADVFANKKVVLFALPGAFTPGCTAAHLPSYVVNIDKLKDKGVDTVACLSVNDAFVMGAWSVAQNAEHILMLADGNAEFTKAVDLTLDASGFGMGTRSQRYAMIINNGILEALEIDGAEIEKSTADHILSLL